MTAFTMTSRMNKLNLIGKERTKQMGIFTVTIILLIAVAICLGIDMIFGTGKDKKWEEGVIDESDDVHKA